MKVETKPEFNHGLFIIEPETAAEEAQLGVLIDAMTIFAERNAKYKDNWRRQGWRGPLYDLRRKVERVWDLLWDAAPKDISEIALPYQPHDTDDALDIINYAAILVRAVREGDRNGAWW